MGQIEMAGFWNLPGIFVIIKIVQSKVSQDWLLSRLHKTFIVLHKMQISW